MVAPPLSNQVALRGRSLGQPDEWERMGPREKGLFLLAYQWVAAVTSRPLKVFGEDRTYEGIFPRGVTALLDFLRIADVVMDDLPAPVVQGVSELAGALDQGDRTVGESRSFLARYASLRDRAVRDLADGGLTVEFEYFGDSPQFPNQLVRHKVGPEDAAPDFVAIFSNKSPADLVAEGKLLREKIRQTGTKLDSAEFELAGAWLVLGIVGVIIAGIIGFFWSWSVQDRKNRVVDATIKAVKENPDLTGPEKVRLLNELEKNQSVLGDLFGGVPWENLIFTFGVVALLIWGVPKVLEWSRTAGPERPERRRSAAEEPPFRRPVSPRTDPTPRPSVTRPETRVPVRTPVREEEEL